MTKLDLRAVIQGKPIDRVVTIELLNKFGNVVASANSAIDVLGMSDATFSEDITEPVAIRISGGTVLATTSSALISPVNGLITYDFSIDIGQAVGDNLIEALDGVYCIYNGDFNQDGVIDALDFALFENNEQNEQDEILSKDIESNVANSVFSL